MFIPYGVKYTVTTAGSVVKFVECESCKGEYVYQLTREEWGSGTSLLLLNNKWARKRAKQESRHLLEEALEKGCDPVPCPFCGWFQQNMVAQMRKDRWRWMTWVGVFAFFTAVAFSMAANSWTGADEDPRNGKKALLFWSVAAVLGVTSLALFLTRHVSARWYNPNRKDAGKRIALGRTLAMSKADFIRQEGQPQQNE